MTYDSIKTIRADEARRMFGVAGEGIVWAVLDGGIHRNHVHFKQHENLPPPLRHGPKLISNYTNHLAQTSNEEIRGSSWVRVFLQPGHRSERPDCVAGHVGLEVRRETGKE